MFIFSTQALIRHLWQFKTFVFMLRCVFAYSIWKTVTIECAYSMEEHALKNVNNCLNTNIYSYRDIWWSKYKSIFKCCSFFNAIVNQTSEAVQNCCFIALASNMCCSIDIDECHSLIFIELRNGKGGMQECDQSVRICHIPPYSLFYLTVRQRVTIDRASRAALCD